MNLRERPDPELTVELRETPAVHGVECIVQSHRYAVRHAMRFRMEDLVRSPFSPASLENYIRGAFRQTLRCIQDCGLPDRMTERLLAHAFDLTGTMVMQRVSMVNAQQRNRGPTRPGERDRGDDLVDSITYRPTEFGAVPLVDEIRREALRDLMQYERMMVEQLQVQMMGGLNPPSIHSEATERRAMTTLRGCLSPEQIEQFDRNHLFLVHVPRCPEFPNGRELEVNTNDIYNVCDRSSDVRYCGVPAGHLPLGDRLLAQKLVLERDPMQFFRVANAKDRNGNLMVRAAGERVEANIAIRRPRLSDNLPIGEPWV